MTDTSLSEVLYNACMSTPLYLLAHKIWVV